MRDTYPGAKRSPIDYVKLLAMPDIKPDMAIKGTCIVKLNLIPICRAKT